jgi:hypothetical protein
MRLEGSRSIRSSGSGSWCLGIKRPRSNSAVRFRFACLATSIAHTSGFGPLYQHHFCWLNHISLAWDRLSLFAPPSNSGSLRCVGSSSHPQMSQISYTSTSDKVLLPQHGHAYRWDTFVIVYSNILFRCWGGTLFAELHLQLVPQKC